jgi:transmembrane sensor
MDGAAQAEGRRAVRDEAAQWVVRLSAGDGDAAERAAFEAWRAADPRHDVAYEREAAAWEALDRLRALRPADPAPDPDLLAPPARPRRVWSEPRRAAAVIAAVAVLGAGVLGPAVITSLASPAYATAVGERRIVDLPDGSRVELNTNSRVVVRFGRKSRTVRLERGEALFSVASDSRPFTITAGDQKVEATAGDVAIRVRQGLVDVLVSSGAASLLAPGSSGMLPLMAGARAHSGDGPPRVERLSAARVDQALAWRHGDVAFEGESLAQAAAEMSRYNAAPIVVADRSIAGLRLAGLFRSNDRNGFVRAVTRTFPVKAREGDDGAVELVRAN